MPEVSQHSRKRNLKKIQNLLCWIYLKKIQLRQKKMWAFIFKDVVSCSGPFRYFKFFLQQNIIQSFHFFIVFIGIINYGSKFFLLYLIQFYTGFLSQSRHLQIEVGGWCGWFRHLESSETKKQKILLLSMPVAPSRTRIKDFY